MKLRVLPDEKFSCSSCTNCCRDWHVELLAGEADRITGLAWATGDPLNGASVLLRHAGKTFLAHRADGACVFLNEANGLCRIHEQFGGEVKPLGCRLYPFQIVPTFGGEATVTARYDCPTVRRNVGVDHAESLPELRRYAGQLPFAEAFDERTRCSFDRDQIQAVCEFADTFMVGFSNNPERALCLTFLSDWLGTLTPGQLDRSLLVGMFGQLKSQVAAAAADRVDRPGLIHRLTFRTLLGMYLRRDEDVLNGRAGRISRLMSMFAFVLGFGSFSGLGVSHPRGSLRAARLFQPSAESIDSEIFALHWRMIRTKLDSQQFMGSANRGRDFLAGLRSLALLYPLVAAAAKYRAATRKSAIDQTDVDYAVAAIEHSFGRSAILAQPFVRSLETFLLNRTEFIRLVRGI